jgi:hypothetical protein
MFRNNLQAAIRKNLQGAIVGLVLAAMLAFQTRGSEQQFAESAGTYSHILNRKLGPWMPTLIGERDFVCRPQSRRGTYVGGVAKQSREIPSQPSGDLDVRHSIHQWVGERCLYYVGSVVELEV